MTMDLLEEDNIDLSNLTPQRAEAIIERCYIDFGRVLSGVDRDQSAAYQAEASLLKQRDAFRSILASLIGHAVRIENIAQSKGADLGCRIGLRTALLALLGCRDVTGCDRLKQYVEWGQQWLSQARIDGLSLVHADYASLPFKSGQLDWIMMRGVYSLVNPRQIAKVFEECARVLKRGGLLLINEFHNPHHGESRSALLKKFAEMEIGTGTANHPNGPIFQARQKIIEEARGAKLSPEAARKLAIETAYMTKPEVLRKLAAVIDRKKSVTSKFDAHDVKRTPVWPETEVPVARFCDPFEIRNELKKAGFACRFRGSFLDGGLDEKGLKSYYASSPGVYVTATKSK
jgi:ubiquinone/menaquinone biosynthesis C-methylase UbiE